MLKDFTQMTAVQKMNAYGAAKERFDLKWQQRDKLDKDPMLNQILFMAHQGHWVTCEVLLKDAGIL